MQKTLVLYSRICPGESIHTIQLFNMLKELPNVTAVKLDGTVPYETVKEQEFIKQFDNVILLFTINWFNLPWNLSRYMAEVWRVGNFNLEGINFYTVVTTGSPQTTYTKDEGFGWTAPEYLNNLSSVFKRLKANYCGQLFFHGCAKPDQEKFAGFVEEVKEYYLTKINK
ncbi:NAD(P)H-dependent oxidoreductase [Ureaplasma ceti]|uniref:Flavodoxin-like fold domain-containing protein n=1 Tax=Ureaplasma ceti TaxID=3119530 RepID=A0ABP9U675_9BACT